MLDKIDKYQNLSKYFSVTILLLLPSVHSLVFTDGCRLVEWMTGQDQANKDSPQCFYYDVRNVTPPYTFLHDDAPEVRITDSDTVSSLLEKCEDVQQPVSLSHLVRSKRSLLDIFKGIYPGTKWCGKGCIATNYTDLGKYWETDVCCRDHDYCDKYIVSGDTRFNYTNKEVYTISDCSCDEKFRKCLQDVDSAVSTAVGEMFFTAIQMKCLLLPYNSSMDTPNINCVIKEAEPYSHKGTSTVNKLISMASHVGKKIYNYFGRK